MCCARDPCAGEQSAPFTRAVLVVNALLAGGAGLSLSLAPGRTGEFFAFEIDPPATAAWMGANFVGGACLQFAAARESLWANASQALAGVLVYVLCVTATLMMNFRDFTLDSAAAWSWLVIYSVSPFTLVLVLRAQGRAPRPPVARPMPRWVRGVIWGLAAPAIAVGVALLTIPEAAARLWPWRLVPEEGTYGGTPTVARYCGAWLAGIGATLVHAGLIGDARRSRPVFIGGLVASALTALALVRFRVEIDGTHPGAWVIAAGAALAAGASAAGLAASRGAAG